MRFRIVLLFTLTPAVLSIFHSVKSCLLGRPSDNGGNWDEQRRKEVDKYFRIACKEASCLVGKCTVSEFYAKEPRC